MKTWVKYLLAIVIAIVGAIAVVALSLTAYALTGSLVVRWVVYAILVVPLWIGMWKLGSYLGKM